MLLHSRIEGSGKPLIIIHGFLGMSDNWKSLGSNYAAEGFEVHMLDLRNHGKSFHSDEFNYSVMTNDIFEYCKHYHLENISIIGHSMGGKVAMLLATMYQNFGTRQFLMKNLYWIESGQLAFRFNLPVFNAKIEIIGEALPTENYFDKPTLFIRGGNSKYILETDLSEIKKHFPSFELATIPNVGHWLHAENPKLFFEETARFLTNEKS